MNPGAVISAVRGENRLLALFREELAPSPTRWRASVRLGALCVVGTAVVTAFYLPGGQFMVLMFFLVAMSDAATSRATLVPNVVGSLAGGAVGVLALAAFADQPWFLFPVQAAVIAGAMFLMRTTTMPGALLFFGVSFAIVVPGLLVAPIDTFYGGMRAVFFQACGIALGTLVQLLWWPEDPGELLRAELAESLRAVEERCDHWQSGTVSAASAATADPPLRALRRAATRLVRQLDLLREAETKDRGLRQRHAGQIKLITDLQLLVLAALEFERGMLRAGTAAWAAGGVPARLVAVRDECRRLRHALADRRPPEPRAPGAEAATGRAAPPPEPIPALDELERILAALPAALAVPGPVPESGVAPPAREAVARRRFLLPASPAQQAEAIRFALKVALAASLCALICQALNWPGIGTCVMTTVLVAQATVGSGLHKATLRFGGALLAGLAALVVIDVFMPNMESLASLLAVTAGLTFIAAWIATGSSRTAYLGVQMGVTLYLVLFTGFGPAVELVPARDRLLGILLGIAVMAVVDVGLWPVFTRSALRRKLAGLLQQLAELQRRAATADPAGADGRRVAIHRGIAEATALQEELAFEATGSDAQAEAERRVVLRVLNRLQEIFLGLLATGRERPALQAAALPATVTAAARNLDRQLASQLDALAQRLADGTSHPVPDLRPALADFTAARAQVAPGPGEPHTTTTVSGLERFEQLNRSLAESLSNLEQDILPVILAPASGPPHAPEIPASAR